MRAHSSQKTQDLIEAAVDRGTDVGHREFSDAGRSLMRTVNSSWSVARNRCVPAAIRVGCAMPAAQGP
jgi:hypothetical protein